jgi:hypothetical protein
MTLIPHKSQVLIIDTAAAHNALITGAEGTFRWFEEAVAGDRAVADMTAQVDAVNVELDGSRGLHETMRNEWDAFVRTLETAYANFGRDIVHRLGVDEQSRVRNLALSYAAGALTRIRERARAHLVQTLEGANYKV